MSNHHSKINKYIKYYTCHLSCYRELNITLKKCKRHKMFSEYSGTKISFESCMCEMSCPFSHIHDECKLNALIIAFKHPRPVL